MYKYDNLVSILETNNEQHKTWTVNENYDFILKDKTFAKWYDFKEIAINNLNDLYALLEQYQYKKRCCFVRGKLNENAWEQRTKGYKIPRKKEYIEDYPKSWVMFDIDNFEKPQGIDLRYFSQRKKAVNMFLESINKQFASTSYICQFSNGMFPTSDKVKAHIWFMLDKPRTCQNLKEYFSAKDYNIDKCVFNPSQIYYTAAPSFIDCIDPLGDTRLFMEEKTNKKLYLL